MIKRQRSVLIISVEDFTGHNHEVFRVLGLSNISYSLDSFLEDLNGSFWNVVRSLVTVASKNVCIKSNIWRTQKLTQTGDNTLTTSIITWQTVAAGYQVSYWWETTLVTAIIFTNCIAFPRLRHWRVCLKWGG